MGSPALEEKLSREKKNWQISSAPPFFSICDYRIAGDSHWEIRQQWIDSNFTLKLEYKNQAKGVWEPVEQISFGDYVQYRIKPNSAP